MNSTIRPLLYGVSLAGVAAVLSLTPTQARSETYSVAGTACHSQASGIIYTTTQVRNEQTSNRSVYCSFPISEAGSSVWFYTWIRNLDTVEKTVNCSLKIGTPLDGYETASFSAVVPANGGSAAQVVGVARNTYWAAMGVACTLPPKTAMDDIYVSVTVPEPI